MEFANYKYRLIIENLPDAFAYHKIVTDNEGKPVDYIFLDVNPAFENMTGRSRGDTIGKKVSEVHPGIESSDYDWISIYGRVALDGETARFEQYSEPLNRWYEVTAYSDEPGCFVVLFRDITTSKKEKDKQELLLDNIETQIWHLEDEKTYSSVNQAHADFFGVKKEELENESLYELMSTKEEAEICIAGNLEVFRRKQKVHSEELVLNGKGEPRLLSITKTPKLDDSNNVEYVVCAAEDITEHSQVEQKLKQSEEKYRALIEQSMDGVFLHDINGNILELNQAAVEQTGYLKEELLNLNVFDLHSESSKVNQEPDVILEQWKSWSVGESKTIEAEHQQKYGRAFPVEIRTGKVVLSDKEYILALVSDITQRKQAENQLRFQSLVLDHIQDRVTVTDLNGVITYVNNAAARALGYSRQELIGAMIEKYGEDPEQGATQREILEETLRSGTWRGEVVNQSVDGREVHMDCRTQVLLDEQENIVALVGIATDITERKQSEKDLRQSEERFQKMLSLIPDMISIHDPDMNIIYSNWNGFGAVPEEKRVLNTKCYRTYRGRNDICPDCQAVNVLQSGEAFQKELELPEGVWVDLRVIPILGEDGSVELIVEWVRDITGIKKTEQEIREQHKLLEGVMDNVSDVLAIQNPDCSIEHCNQASYDLLGMTPEEVIGKKCYEIIGRNLKCDECATSKALQTKKLEQLEKYVPELGIYLDCRSNPVLDKDGNVVRVVEQLRNITGQKEKEKQVKDSEQRLNMLISQTPAVIYSYILTNEMPEITYVNENIKHVLGFEPKDFINNFELFKECLHPEDIQKVFDAIPKVMAEGRVILGEYRFKDKCGNYRWLYDEQKLITHEDGTLEVIGAWWDITERKQAEQIAAESEKKFRYIAEFSPLPLVIIDNDGNYEYINPKFEEVFGYTLSDIPTGREWFRLAYPDPDYRREIIKIWQSDINSIGKNALRPRTFTVTCKDGTEKDIFFRSVFMDNEKHLMTCEDITEQKRYEEQLRYISLCDQLTGLYNRFYLEEEMKRLDTERQLPISIIMVDLNGLKLINDTYGHSTGDEMIKTAAKILKEACRKEDIIARWGGDEFVILLPQTTDKTALEICKRVHNKYSKTYVKDLPMSMSSGTSSKDNTDKDLKEALKEAEDNMYKHKLTESRSGKSGVLKALLKTLEEKSNETEAHARRMYRLALKIGEKVELPNSELSRLGLVITLHDIGKIIIPEEVLTKKSALTEEEWEIIKKHPETGYRIALSTEEFAHVAEDILSHHERWDGTGYPRGLKGEEIPLLARITAIADAYEVMTNGRPYKKAMSHEEVVAEIKGCAGNQFDPELVKVFLSFLEADKHISAPGFPH